MNENIADVLKNISASQTANIATNTNFIGLISNFPPGKLMAMIIFSLLGTAYFIYGKRMAQFSFIIVGIALMIFTYLFTNTLYLFLTGLCLTILPFSLKNI